MRLVCRGVLNHLIDAVETVGREAGVLGTAVGDDAGREKQGNDRNAQPPNDGSDHNALHGAAHTILPRDARRRFDAPC